MCCDPQIISILTHAAFPGVLPKRARASTGNPANISGLAPRPDPLRFVGRLQLFFAPSGGS